MRYRTMVAEILSFDSNVVLRTPDGDIGFFILFPSGSAIMVLVPPGEDWEMNVAAFRKQLSAFVWLLK